MQQIELLRIRHAISAAYETISFVILLATVLFTTGYANLIAFIFIVYFTFIFFTNSMERRAELKNLRDAQNAKLQNATLGGDRHG